MLSVICSHTARNLTANVDLVMLANDEFTLIVNVIVFYQVNEFCKIIGEFSLEYRTTRERVIQMKKKKENMRERSKTRGKLITETEVKTYIWTLYFMNYH